MAGISRHPRVARKPAVRRIRRHRTPSRLPGSRLHVESLENRVLLNADDALIYVSTQYNGNVDGISFKREDILVYDPVADNWAMQFRWFRRGPRVSKRERCSHPG